MRTPNPSSEEGHRVRKPPRTSLLPAARSGSKAQTSGEGFGRAGQGSDSVPSPKDPLRPLARTQAKARERQDGERTPVGTPPSRCSKPRPLAGGLGGQAEQVLIFTWTWLRLACSPAQIAWAGSVVQPWLGGRSWVNRAGVTVPARFGVSQAVLGVIDSADCDRQRLGSWINRPKAQAKGGLPLASAHKCPEAREPYRRRQKAASLGF